MKSTRRPALLTVGLTVALVIAASGSSAAAPRVRANNKLTKRPIPIMGTGTFSGPTQAFPQMKVGIQSAVDAINASGGINGHPLQLTLCNDQDNPDVAQSCGQQAVSRHDVAVVTADDPNDATLIPILQAAHIPFIGGITMTKQDATSPISFPGAPGGYNGNGADAVAAKAAGCKRVVTVTVIVPGATKTIEDTALSGLRLARIPNLKLMNVSLSATNFAPVVETATVLHANCMVAIVAENETTAVIAQAHQTAPGLKLLVASVNTAPLNTIASIDHSTYMFAFSSVPGEIHGPAGLKIINRDVAKYGGGGAMNPTTYGGFAAVLLLKDALVKIHGAYTAKSVLAAMDHLTNAPTDGVYPPYTTSKPTGVPGENREFNPDAITLKLEGSHAVPVSSFEPIPGI